MLNRFEVVENASIYFEELKWNNKLAVAVSYEESHSKTKDVPFEFKKEFYCFAHKDIIYEYSLKMLVRKDFRLLKELNNFIKYANECGLIDKWLKVTDQWQRKSSV